MNGRKNVGVLAGVTVVAIAASAVLAFATIDPPPLPVKHRKVSVVAAVPATASKNEPKAEPKSEPKAEPAPALPAAAKPASSPSPAPAPASAAASPASSAIDWPSVALDDVRRRANAGEIPAMEEIGRRLLQGIGTAKDPQAGAGWLLRAAGLGSAQSAFNVGVMYERGFVVERDSSKAAEWYRRAANAGLPTAKHNLALMLRDGKGMPRDVKAAMALLLSAAHQGMAASMFTLGDIYEQGDDGTKDPAAALAWFAITGEFERQTNREPNRDSESALAKTANQRAQILKRTLTTAELERAQELAQIEFRQIVSALAPAPRAAAPAPPPPPPLTDATIDWPTSTADQIRAVQQGLFDLKRLRDKPDGTLGPVTRAAIRDFQKSAGLRETGEPSREVYMALVSARHDVVSESPLPMPAAPAALAPPEQKAAAAAPEQKPAPAAPEQKPAPAAPEAKAAPEPKPEPVPPPGPDQPTSEKTVELGAPAPPPAPPTSAEVAATTPPAPPTPAPPKIDPPKPPPVAIDTTKPPAVAPDIVRPPVASIEIPAAAAPPPVTSADLARTTPPPAAKPEPAKAAIDAWPARKVDQTKAIQTLLRDLRFYGKAVDGQASTATTAAIRDYQRTMGLKETGEPSKALFESLKEIRKMMQPVPAVAN